MLKRLFDFFFALSCLLLFLPFFILTGIIIRLTSGGGIIYRQKRVGKNNRDFTIYKFRTMKTGSDRSGLLTIGENDTRITATGRYLRKYKLDELPQLFNILKGDMSFVGPRPEVRRYVEMYSETQKRVLSVKPGLTDMASLKYYDENLILGNEKDPEQVYIEKIMPEKLDLNLEYLEKRSLCSDVMVLFKTFARILGKK